MPFSEEVNRKLRNKRRETGNKDLAFFKVFQDAFAQEMSFDKMFRERKKNEPRFKRQKTNNEFSLGGFI